MHAYAATFRALDLAEGDALVELGGGTGYGAAIARAIVGDAGRVTTIEIVAELAEEARALLGDRVEVICADAHEVARWRGARKVAVGFEVDEIPAAWLDALAPGGRLVAPVRGKLTQFTKDAAGAVAVRVLGDVRYVRDRAASRAAGQAEAR